MNAAWKSRYREDAVSRAYRFAGERAHRASRLLRYTDRRWDARRGLDWLSDRLVTQAIFRAMRQMEARDNRSAGGREGTG
jgi:hypothetical protein